MFCCDPYIVHLPVVQRILIDGRLATFRQLNYLDTVVSDKEIDPSANIFHDVYKGSITCAQRFLTLLSSCARGFG